MEWICGGSTYNLGSGPGALAAVVRDHILGAGFFKAAHLEVARKQRDTEEARIPISPSRAFSQGFNFFPLGSRS